MESHEEWIGVLVADDDTGDNSGNSLMQVTDANGGITTYGYLRHEGAHD